jgi:hypothetical protein
MFIVLLLRYSSYYRISAEDKKMSDKNKTETSQASEKPQRESDSRFSRLAAAAEAAYILQAVRA